MATLLRMMRSFEAIGKNLFRRDEIIAPLESEIIPCLNCGKSKVVKAHGQIVRFCSKDCRNYFRHGWTRNS